MQVLTKHFTDKNQLSCYGLYSISQNRFIFHTARDHWSLLDAAKLLSSKLSTVLCFSTKEPFPFEKANCLQWTLKDKKMVLSKHQTPTIHHVSSISDLEYIGTPVNVDLRLIQKDYDFVNFVYKAVLAARHVEMTMSLNHIVHNEEQNFYLDLVAAESTHLPFISRKDQTIWEKGFLNTIYRIIYFSDSEEEVTEKILELKTQISLSPDQGAKKISSYYLNMYFEYIN